MENEFDYSKLPDDLDQQEIPTQQSQPEPAPEQPVSYGSPYNYSGIPTPEPQPQPQPQPQPIPVAPAPEAPKQKKSGKGLVVAIAIVAAVLMVFNVIMLATNAWQYERNDTLAERIDALQKQIAQLEKNQGTSVPNTPGQAATPDGLYTPQQVYAMNVDAVVAVTSEGTTTTFGQTSKTTSAGSGFIVSANGFVVTNYHVIEGGKEIKVITSDSVVHKAMVVGYDETNDVAVLKVEGENFPAVVLGSSDELNVGDQVMAIGNPLGELTSTLTVGYVSAKDRMVSTDGTAINMLQTDAAINSGNSGGPLFNAKGEVVGINTAKYSGTSSSGATIEGIGFAIPIDDVIGIILDLQDKGYVSTTYLGVMVKEVTAEGQAYGLPAGAYVDEVTTGYCAEEAGVQAKDIIVALGEHKVDSLSALTRALRRFKPGDKTTITVYRSGQEVTLEITLDEKPVEDTVVEEQPDATEPTEGSFNYPGDIWDYFFPGN